MANVNAPNGFTPMRHLAGGVIRSRAYVIASSGTTGYNDTIRQGDPVKQNTDGTVELAAAGDTLLGIFEGVQYTASDGTPVYDSQWTASTAIKSGTTITAWVYDDPNITYRAQMATHAATDVGDNADFNAGTGSSTTRRSGAYVGAVAGGTANFRILGLVAEPDNAVGANAKVEVFINEHAHRTAAGV